MTPATLNTEAHSRQIFRIYKRTVSGIPAEECFAFTRQLEVKEKSQTGTKQNKNKKKATKAETLGPVRPIIKNVNLLMHWQNCLDVHKLPWSEKASPLLPSHACFPFAGRWAHEQRWLQEMTATLKLKLNIWWGTAMVV